MSDIAIRVQNISKRYLIGDTSSGSLRETIGSLFGRSTADDTKEFYALRDVSFEVRRGDAIGIIGKNGAGKSTLLKVLSRITEPTTGRVEIDGRVSSLLEVGTGFHPELTGRENVFLNGTILGMKRQEIKDKFDEIVDFSGVEKFLDTPVKRYSSGMKVRLAFAVAAHLEPEILIIDEVLAVGDAEFQRKCLGKMEDISGQGRTVLFVSHNMSAVRSLCPQAIQLKHGQVVYQGEVNKAIDSYLNVNSGSVGEGGEVRWDGEKAPESSEIKLIAACLMNSQGITKTKFDTSEEISVVIDYQVKQSLKGMRTVLKINTNDGVLAFASTDHLARESTTRPGFYRTVCKIPPNILNKIPYFIEVHFGIPGVKTLIHPVKLFEFEIENIFSSSGSYFPEKWPGAVAIPIEWTTQEQTRQTIGLT